MEPQCPPTAVLPARVPTEPSSRKEYNADCSRTYLFLTFNCLVRMAVLRNDISRAFSPLKYRRLLAAGVTVAFHGLFFTVHECPEEVSICGRQRPPSAWSPSSHASRALQLEEVCVRGRQRLRPHGYRLHLLLQGCPSRCRCNRLSLYGILALLLVEAPCLFLLFACLSNGLHDLASSVALYF